MVLIAISCAWILGLFFGLRYSTPIVLAVTAAFPIIVFIFVKKNPKLFIISSIVIVTFFGSAILYSGVHANTDLNQFNNQGSFEFRGMVSDEPEIQESTASLRFRVDVIKISSNWQKMDGNILLFVQRYPEYHYGDILWLKGEIKTPPKFDTFDYQTFLNRQGVYSVIYQPQIKLLQTGAGSQPNSWLYALRKKLSNILSEILPEPQASLCQGVVLGMRSNIPESLKSDFAVSGTTHILAISGANLSIIAGILVAFGIWVFGRRHYLYVWIALFLIWFYSLLVGMQAPVIRSAIMASIFLVAELFGRQKNILVALVISAAIMISINPQVIWDVSFQLSFLAMIGLIFFAPPLQNMLRRITKNHNGEGAKVANFLLDSSAVTIAVMITVWPLLSYYFNLISIASPFATILISPSLPAIIITGGLAAFAGLFSINVALVIGWVVWVFLSYMIWMVTLFASLPFAAFSNGQINSTSIWWYYAFLGIFLEIKHNFNKLTLYFTRLNVGDWFTRFGSALENTISKAPKIWLFAPLFCLAFLTSFAAATLPDSQLHISFLDAKDGDSVLIQSSNQNILVNGGGDSQSINQGLGEKIPFWNRNLDLVIATNTHQDNLVSLIEILKRYRVRKVISPELGVNSPVSNEWDKIIKEGENQNTIPVPGQSIKLNKGAELKVLDSTSFYSPKLDPAKSSLVLRLSRGNITFLLVSDLNSNIESSLIHGREDLSSTVINLTSGSLTDISPDFLRMLNPQYAVVSPGTQNQKNSSNYEVLDNLVHAFGNEERIFSTGRNGTVEFITDGQHLRIKTEARSDISSGY